MPHRDSAPHGAPCWIDLASSDPARATEFYSQLFGWTAQQGGEEYGGYVTFLQGDNVVAGMMKNEPDSGYPDVWSTYLATDDAAATVEAARSAGSHIALEPVEVTTQGTMALLSDASGAMVGVWQPADHKGYTVMGEPGTPIS